MTRSHRRRSLVGSLALVMLMAGAVPTVAVGQTDPPVVVTAGAVLRHILEAFGLQVSLPSMTNPGETPATTSAKRPVPSNLTPSLAHPDAVKPRSYADGCHRRDGQTTVKTCIYGDPHGAITVVLFGDSHAAMWLPGLDSMAARRGWKLYSVTKSACPVAKVSTFLRGKAAPDCNTWRTNAIRYIDHLSPDYVIATSFEPYPIKGKGAPTSKASYAAWQAGLRTTLGSLAPHAGMVIWLGQTPKFRTLVPVCLAKHRSDTRPCDAPRSFALSTTRETQDRSSVVATGATFMTVSDITCPDSPCASVIGRYMVSFDDHHMSPAFVKHLIPQLEAKLPIPASP